MPDDSSIGEPESSGEDSISLTSTVVEDEGDYEVECIMAESEKKGVISYLTNWSGYGEMDFTWQYRDTFGSPEPGGHDVFKEWQERKMRIARGYEESFDVSDWEWRKWNDEKKTEKRKARRRRKRARLNPTLNIVPSDAETENDRSNKNSKRKRHAQGSTSLTSDEDTEHEEQEESPLWTNAEKQCFLKSLEEAGGPHFNQILAWYGVRGSVNRILRGKSIKDMQEQLQTFRKEFSEVGRDPPEYLNNTGIPRKLRHSKIQDDSDESQTSSDSMMEELRAGKKSKSKKEKKVPKSSQLDITRKDKTSQPIQSNKQSLSQGHLKRVKKETSSTVDLRDVPVKVTQRVDRQRDIAGIAGASGHKGSYSGTARAPASKAFEEFRRSNQGRTGFSGRKPARLAAHQVKNVSGRPIVKPRTSGIDVTANWSSQPPIRRAKTLPTTNAAADTGKSAKLFKTLGMRNSVQKWRRNEPAPDPAQLVFIDPKTGKAPKPSLASSVETRSSVLTAKSPFQKYQEGLEGKASEENNPMKGPNPTATEDDELFVDSSDLITAGGRFSNGNSANIEKGTQNPLATIDRLMSSDNSIKPPPPANAPKGPRSYSTPSLDRSGRQKLTPAAPLATTIVRPKTESESPSPLTLKGYPSQQETLALRNTWEECLVIANIRFGPTRKDIGKMRFAGIDKPIQKLLLTLKNPLDPRDFYFDFDKICSSTDFQNYWHDESSGPLGGGYVVPAFESQAEYESVAELLSCHISGGLLFAEAFTIIMWPAQSSVWDFLEKKLPAVPPGTILRFALCEPTAVSQSLDQTEPRVISRLSSEDAEKYNEIKGSVDRLPMQPDEKPINVVFREVFKIDFDRLVASNGNQRHLSGKDFFLCFIPANCTQYEVDDKKRQALRLRTSEEHDLFVQFLRANGAEAIYSFQDIGSYEIVSNGSWRHFIEKVKSGAIIIHERCGRPDQLRHIAKFLTAMQGLINVWMTSLSNEDPLDSHGSHIVRCFPHGGVILLSVSLMMYRPHEALRVLRWFRLELLPSKSRGTWKIAVRPRIREWLLDLHDVCCKKTWKSPFGDFHLQVYADIRTEILFLLECDVEPFGLMVEKWDTEIPLPEAPVVAQGQLLRARKEWAGDSFETAQIDHVAVRWNDDELIQWFSEWAGLHIRDYRKFCVVLGYPRHDKGGDHLLKCYEKGYGNLEDHPPHPDRQDRGLVKNAWERNFLDIMPYDRFFTALKVTDMATLDQKEATRHEKVREQTSKLRIENEAEFKLERQAASECLATIMENCRAKGATEEQARAIGRRHLMRQRDHFGTASSKEVEDCAIDMDLRPSTRHGWVNAIIGGTDEERKAALEAVANEKQRIANKEILLGTAEQEQIWEEEIRFWAARDQEKEEAIGTSL